MDSPLRPHQCTHVGTAKAEEAEEARARVGFRLRSWDFPAAPAPPTPSHQSGWSQLGGDIVGEAAGDESGGSVALSGDGIRVAVGAAENDGGGPGAGHARVYEAQVPAGLLSFVVE